MDLLSLHIACRSATRRLTIPLSFVTFPYLQTLVSELFELDSSYPLHINAYQLENVKSKNENVPSKEIKNSDDLKQVIDQTVQNFERTKEILQTEQNQPKNPTLYLTVATDGPSVNDLHDAKTSPRGANNQLDRNQNVQAQIEAEALPDPFTTNQLLHHFFEDVKLRKQQKQQEQETIDHHHNSAAHKSGGKKSHSQTNSGEKDVRESEEGLKLIDNLYSLFESPLLLQFAPRKLSGLPQSNIRDSLTISQDDSSGLGAVHYGTLCDGCRQFIRGMRYKCLECIDYELCSSCYSSRSSPRPASSHASRSPLEWFQSQEKKCDHKLVTINAPLPRCWIPNLHSNIFPEARPNAGQCRDGAKYSAQRSYRPPSILVPPSMVIPSPSPASGPLGGSGKGGGMGGSGTLDYQVSDSKISGYPNSQVKYYLCIMNVGPLAWPSDTCLRHRSTSSLPLPEDLASLPPLTLSNSSATSSQPSPRVSTPQTTTSSSDISTGSFVTIPSSTVSPTSSLSNTSSSSESLSTSNRSSESESGDKPNEDISISSVSKVSVEPAVPGQIVSICLPLSCPAAPGCYTSIWRLYSASLTNSRYFGDEYQIVVYVLPQPPQLSTQNTQTPTTLLGGENHDQTVRRVSNEHREQDKHRKSPRGGQQSPSPSVCPPEWLSQYNHCLEMGFGNKEQVIAALHKTKGNLDQTLDLLLK